MVCESENGPAHSYNAAYAAYWMLSRWHVRKLKMESVLSFIGFL